MEYTNLRQLFGAYFHQDWIEVAQSDDWRVTAGSFARDTSRSNLDATVLDLHELLHSSSDERSLRKFVFDELYCNYYPGDGSLDMTDWLLDLAAFLQSECSNR